MTASTRDRLLDAAQTLFAARGFNGTSVGDIEELAGFAKRGGTLYKHFTSKDEVLSAVIDRHAESVQSANTVVDLLPLGDVRAELTLLARFVLAELTDEEEIHRVLDCAGEQADDARERMLAEVLEPGYRQGAVLLERWIGSRTRLSDPEATAVLLFGGLLSLRRYLWTFGRVPLDIDDDRAVDAWVDVALAITRPEERGRQ